MKNQANRLYIACILALVTMAFRVVVAGVFDHRWGVRFNLSETQIGSIQGAGLFPQALSIIFFSLIIDKVGYGRVMAFAWCAHVLSRDHDDHRQQLSGALLGHVHFALAAGAVERRINPITATLFFQK